jgi:hypothetical protein
MICSTGRNRSTGGHNSNGGNDNGETGTLVGGGVVAGGVVGGGLNRYNNNDYSLTHDTVMMLPKPCSRSWQLATSYPPK